MLIKDHRLRTARLLRGERRVEDLNRLFADLRLHRPIRPSVQEIGHFAAHRDERDSGISLARVDDIQISARRWLLQQSGTKPSIEYLEEAGLANLRIMPERSIKEKLGISHQTAKQSFKKAIKKMRENCPLKERELRCLQMFGLSMMWQFAFSDDVLWSDFVDILVDEGALADEDRNGFETVSTFVSLYALTVMHGARLKMADGNITWLRLAESDDSGLLRIKAEIPIVDTPKPVISSVSIFETALKSRDHCDPDLLAKLDEPIPAEIDGDRLIVLG